MAEPSPKDAGSAPSEPAKLDELMMAMDVVDTLRHEERVVARELGQDDRDEALKARLRALYEGQGLEVSERILEEGIAALKENRFVYEPPEPSWRVTAAKLWVSRMRWAPWAGGAAALLILWLGWSAITPSVEDRLAGNLETAAAEAGALATGADATAAVTAAAEAGRRALSAGESDQAEAALARLEALKTELGLAYEIRIVSRPGERSGVYRIPDVNTQARNYYLIVEAIGPGGDALPRPIRSEEDGQTRTVTIWGQRVPEAVYQAVGRDKQEDGIVQDAVLGVKPAGRLAPDWRMAVEAGAITEWDR